MTKLLREYPEQVYLGKLDGEDVYIVLGVVEPMEE